MKKPPLLYLSALLSGFLLYLSYPPFPGSFAAFAWVALAPLWIAIRRSGKPCRAARCTFFAALAFFIPGIAWLTHVTVFGWLFIAIYLSLFYIPLGWFAAGALRNKPLWLSLLGFPLAWTSIELLRTELPVVGLGWNLLGYSQAFLTPMIQVASVTGIYGLSFLMVLTNVLAGEVFLRLLEKRNGFQLSRTLFLFLLAVSIPAMLYLYGSNRIKESPQPDGQVRVGVVQGNIPQSVKWEPMARDEIIAIHLKHSEFILLEEPDLIIWPEASFPGYFNRSPYAAQVEEWTEANHANLLLGAPYYESYEKAYNSAYLVGSDGEVQERYDKNFLVPFGEYVPFDPVLNWLKPLARAMGISNFAGGKGGKIFRLKESGAAFSVLICFEDIFPGLARDFASDDVRFLVVMTNDAWFGPTGAAWQHLQASVFRAVENGLPLIRAANTGVSAFITPDGTLQEIVQNEKGESIFIPGHETSPVALVRRQTLYREGGWLFPYLAFAAFAIILFVVSFGKKQNGYKTNTDVEPRL